jgi:sec-independent protein translocase protein TatA
VFNIGPTEMLVILLLALIVFGPKRLPEIGRTVGKGLREFRRASQDIRDEIQSTIDDEQTTPKVAGRTPSVTEPAPPSASDAPRPDGAGPTA